MAQREVAVLAPSVFVSITVEAGLEEGDDIHIHAGGQGVWVARMLCQFGVVPVVCAPVGGETGNTLQGLMDSWGLRLSPVRTTSLTPAYVHDRRDGQRVELARSPLPMLHRHEVDELYNRILELSLRTGVCVVTGPVGADQLPVDVYERLGSDLHAANVRVVGDLHGKELLAFLENGPMEVLKVSVGDLVEDGLLAEAASEPGGEGLIADAIDHLTGLGVAMVVVSRGDQPALVGLGDGEYRLITGPELVVVDAAGSGDSMTAALASASIDGLDAEAALRRAWAAGAANVTRHGLGSGIPDLIDELSQQVAIERWERRPDDRRGHGDPHGEG